MIHLKLIENYLRSTGQWIINKTLTIGGLVFGLGMILPIIFGGIFHLIPESIILPMVIIFGVGMCIFLPINILFWSFGGAVSSLTTLRNK